MAIWKCPNRSCRHRGRPIVRVGRESTDCPECFEGLVPLSPYHNPEAILVSAIAERELHWARFHPGENPSGAVKWRHCSACQDIDHVVFNAWELVQALPRGGKNA